MWKLPNMVVDPGGVLSNTSDKLAKESAGSSVYPPGWSLPWPLAMFYDENAQ